VARCTCALLQMVRIVLDNTNNQLLRSLNEGMFAPFDPYNNRQDVIRWACWAVATSMLVDYSAADCTSPVRTT
jgi:hypothetical protein